uniref:PB1 domain-containing protein n=1 Tax=Cajanus cajan TaxID=3821 RepID=A0A151SRC2_CAJCA|nr:hypothetical protein KK1_003603 [Cajanus cajan]
MGKKKKQVGEIREDGKVGDSGPGAYDNDTMVFISMSQELKNEGNKLFQKRDLEGALLKYEKALKLLPKNHIDVSYLRSNMAACYMQMGLSEFPRAIHECDLALEVTPKYSKALLKRARCYEALNRLDLALRDVTTVVKMEPNNLMALEILEKKANREEEKAPDEKILEKQTEEKFEEKKAEGGGSVIVVEKKINASKKKKAKEKIDEKKAEIKEVIEERSNGRREDVPKKTAKLIFGDDIRCTEIPFNCSLFQLREVIYDRFPSLGAVLVKYRDQEGDLVTITSDDELSINGASENGCVGKAKEIVGSSCIEDWIIQFAKLFKNHVGFESDRYLDFHELGMKLYSEALEETVTSEEAQGLFDMAGDKFQEMTALALFNWGNVHMSRARKKVYFREDSSKEQLCEQIKSSYEWALEEYSKAGEKYEAAIKIKSDFHEGFLALGLQQFEQAKLSWYHALSGNVDLLTWPSTEVLHLYNNAEENMEKGMQMWEESEKQNLRLPIWHESLEVAINKFELAGASPTDIAVILKNHCSNDTAVDGLAFKIDEIVQAWNEMYKAKKWQGGVPSFRLEPLFRRRVSKIYHAFELA